MISKKCDFRQIDDVIFFNDCVEHDDEHESNRRSNFELTNNQFSKIRVDRFDDMTFVIDYKFSMFDVSLIDLKKKFFVFLKNIFMLNDEIFRTFFYCLSCVQNSQLIVF
jgi:hypothetical protein